MKTSLKVLYGSIFERPTKRSFDTVIIAWKSNEYTKDTQHIRTPWLINVIVRKHTEHVNTHHII